MHKKEPYSFKNPKKNFQMAFQTLRLITGNMIYYSIFFLKESSKKRLKGSKKRLQDNTRTQKACWLYTEEPRGTKQKKKY